MLTTAQIEVAEELLECDPDATSQDLVVDEHLLTQSQANVIAFERKKVAPGEHLAEQFKRADKALDDTGALHLRDVAAALAKK